MCNLRFAVQIRNLHPCQLLQLSDGAHTHHLSRGTKLYIYSHTISDDSSNTRVMDWKKILPKISG